MKCPGRLMPSILIPARPRHRDVEHGQRNRDAQLRVDQARQQRIVDVVILLGIAAEAEVVGEVVGEDGNPFAGGDGAFRQTA